MTAQAVDRTHETLRRATDEEDSVSTVDSGFCKQLEPAVLRKILRQRTLGGVARDDIREPAETQRLGKRDGLVEEAPRSVRRTGGTNGADDSTFRDGFGKHS